jgi:transposase-like protein
MTIECPICGSTKLERKITKETLKGDMGKSVEYKKIFYRCSDCESEGDFFEENTGTINSALETLKKEYIKSTLDYFIEKKISFSSVERILNLPQRTLTKWKNNTSQPSAASMALLKFLCVFPWLLDIAEHSYDYDTSQKIFLQSAFDIWQRKISFFKNDTVETDPVKTNKSEPPYIRADHLDVDRGLDLAAEIKRAQDRLVESRELLDELGTILVDLQDRRGIAAGQN